MRPADILCPTGTAGQRRRAATWVRHAAVVQKPVIAFRPGSAPPITALHSLGLLLVVQCMDFSSVACGVDHGYFFVIPVQNGVGVQDAPVVSDPAAVA